MGIFFSKKKEPSRVTEQDKAVLQLKITRDKLKVYQKRVEENIEKDRNLAKKLLQNNCRDRAMLLLRKKKYQEKILVRTDDQLENLERMVHDLEFALIETKVVNGLKIGNESLKKLHDLLSIDEIESLLHETRECWEKQQEIDAMLSGGLNEEEEDNIAGELHALMKEFGMKSLLEEEPEEPIEQPLPDVPEDEPSRERGREREAENNSREPVALEA